MSKRPAFLDRTAIVGVGFSDLSRNSGRSVLALAADAVRAAIADAGLETSDIDGIATFSWQNDSVPAQAVATTLGVPRLNYILDAAMGGQAPCHLVAQAAMAVEAGLASHVVVYRALNGRSGLRVGRVRPSGGASNYRLPIGLNAYPQVIALWARRYMIETDTGPEDLAAVPLSQRRFAADNPRAMVTRPLTLDSYLAEPFVADPFRKSDCTSEVDGACAVVVSAADATRVGVGAPIVIHSAAYAAGPQPGLDAADCQLWGDYTRNYTSHLADRLWGWSAIRREDLDCAQLYDCFSSSVLLAIEGLGLAPRGEAADFVREGRLPVNTNGGLLCEGYLHGMNTVAEAVLQLQGRAPGYQVANAASCLVTSGALMDGSALVLARS